MSLKINKTEELGVGEIRAEGSYLSIDYVCNGMPEGNVRVPATETVLVNKDPFAIGHLVYLLSDAYTSFEYFTSFEGQRDLELEGGGQFGTLFGGLNKRKLTSFVMDLQSQMADYNEAIAGVVMKYHNMTQK